jgi:hypothetical protein
MVDQRPLRIMASHCKEMARQCQPLTFRLYPLSYQIQRTAKRAKAKESGGNNLTEGDGQGSAGPSAMSATADMARKGSSVLACT